jgi:hypothetical protein
MDVFVIPFAGNRYELYFEQAHDIELDDEPPASGFFGRLKQRFTHMLRAAEERQRRGHQDEAPKGWLAWTQEKMLAWVAERIAEQRLLWNLRRETAAVVVHPSDMNFDDAVAEVKRTLGGDYNRHRLWLIVDTVFLIASGAVAIVPGPNLIAYFFAFRVVGHWLSMRGASQGMHRIEWSSRPCPPLTELREASQLDPRARNLRIGAIARLLHLQNLTRFYERLTVRHTTR